jgi:1-acyl-sn-glycerol-3-phosphate acyltransferase
MRPKTGDREARDSGATGIQTVRLPSWWVLVLRAAVFQVFMVVSIALYTTIGLLIAYPMSFQGRYRLLTTWADINLWWLARVCRLDYRVEGVENIPAQPSIIMSNHQSAWETLALQQVFPPLTWVVKRELLWLPLFGWGLALIEPIALDRAAGRKAVDQLVRLGHERAKAGRWIIVFPQGTRVAPGNKLRYKAGGAILAAATQVPVVPVAHNAGYFWPRRGFIKYPGTITVSVGPPIETRGKSPEAILHETQAWIEATQERIGAPRFVYR